MGQFLIVLLKRLNGTTSSIEKGLKVTKDKSLYMLTRLSKFLFAKITIYLFILASMTDHLSESYLGILLTTSIDNRGVTTPVCYLSFQDLMERVVPSKDRSLRADGSLFS